jgi:hypothetical protein
MAKKKSAGKPSGRIGKKKASTGKKAGPRRKVVQRKKPSRSKASSRRRSVQIHQGVGAIASTHSESTPEIPDDAAEYGGES